MAIARENERGNKKTFVVAFLSTEDHFTRKGLDSSWRDAAFCFRFFLKTYCSFHHFSLSPSSTAFSDSFLSLPSLPPLFSSIGGDIKVSSYPKLHIFHYEIKSIKMDFMLGLIYPFSLPINDELLHSPQSDRTIGMGCL